MKLIISPDSHIDHIKRLSEKQRARLLELAEAALVNAALANHSGPVLTASFRVPEVPQNIDIQVPCDLVGPATGFPRVVESRVHYAVRAGRTCASRLVRDAPRPLTSLVTVVAGPHLDEPLTLYTIYGGPQAPREPGDPNIGSWAELEASRAFWRDHALVAF